ncbi:hypothetical protein H5410_014782 [Solanum commersonii]|uniref:Uncharacterized protein n=1 Tax=Solanum commersonii TaxID=4109 RepID=A0A9J5ZRX2_SOLCO|nr:hypothetical protein H5410_014782 [Solanum commersonii]
MRSIKDRLGRNAFYKLSELYGVDAGICMSCLQIFKRGALKDENIVVFMHNDTAKSELNPRPGVIINHLNGSGVYVACLSHNIIVISLLENVMGMSSALDTFSGQSYGAKQYHMLGIHMDRSMIILSLVCIPLAVIWANTGSILKFLGQDPSIFDEAGHYALYFLTGLGVKGAALANSISYWLNFLFLALCIKFSPTCAKTWTGLSKEALKDMLAFVGLAIPSAIMPSLNTSAIVWMISIGLSGTVRLAIKKKKKRDRTLRCCISKQCNQPNDASPESTCRLIDLATSIK